MLIKKALKLLYVQVLIGLALGILVGYLFPDFGASLKVLGDLFVKRREDDDRADRVLHDRHRHHVAHRLQEDRQDARASRWGCSTS